MNYVKLVVKIFPQMMVIGSQIQKTLFNWKEMARGNIKAQSSYKVFYIFLGITSRSLYKGRKQ